MKISYQGQNGFLVEEKKVSVVCNPPTDFSKSTEFTTLSNPEGEAVKFETKKVLHLPGEFEISKILVKGIFSDNRNNVVFKIVADDIAVANLGSMEDIPDSSWFESLGENVSLVMITVSEKMDAKKAKDLIEKIDPRYALITGDQSQFPKLKEMGAQIPEEDSLVINKSALVEDRTEIFLFS